MVPIRMIEYESYNQFLDLLDLLKKYKYEEDLSYLYEFKKTVAVINARKREIIDEQNCEKNKKRNRKVMEKQKKLIEEMQQFKRMKDEEAERLIREEKTENSARWEGD